VAPAAGAGRWAATRGSDDETRAMKNKLRILLLALDHDGEEEGLDRSRPRNTIGGDVDSSVGGGR